MPESMSGLRRTCRCAEVTEEQLGQQLTVMGWVQKRRNLGGLIFVDLRDRSGLLQVVFDEPEAGETVFTKAETLRSEFVIAVTGILRVRDGAVNDNLETGRWELLATDLCVLSESDTPPFPVEDGAGTREELRLRHRYLDLRRPSMQRNLALRSRVCGVVRSFLQDEGFLEIETPMLCRSTPEGARDYLVPSREHPGSFYALPQSPQLFKQLLMVSGCDRYFQIARCFRDEDLRADRQPEFTQIDMELSFVDVDTVLEVNERLLERVFRETMGVSVPVPFPRMSWQEAMDRFGSDKPDTRFGMELFDVSTIAKDCGFGVFENAIAKGGSVRGICVPGQAQMPRKKLDKLVEHARSCGAGGLAWLAKNEDGSWKSSFAKFVSDDALEALRLAGEAAPSDLLLFAADSDKIVWEVLGSLRCMLAKELALIPEDRWDFLWVTEFPQFEWSEDQGRFVAMHHPFTMPAEADLDRLVSDPASVRAQAYDIVLNGTELGGGSIRIHRSDVQEKMFEALGFSREEAQQRFGFLLEAFRYGVPPHAGLAYGLDRMIMLMAKADSLREVIAFPKVKDASDLLTEAPGAVEEKQLEELGIAVLEGSPEKQSSSE